MSRGHIDQRELKLKCKADFKNVQDFVNAFDPCGLIEGGAPHDEYDCLTSHLVNGVYTNTSRQELKDVILHEIEHHFGTPDLSIFEDPYKTEFYKGLDTLLDKLASIKPSH